MVPIGKFGLLLFATMLCAGKALATENIICSSADEKAAMGFVVGTTPGLSPLSLTMDANGKSWATKPEGSQIGILVAQAFSDDDVLQIDIADDNAEQIIAKLRVTRAHEYGQEPIAAGTLHIVGVGAWPVICGGE
ncbi:hypothetical protein [Taklimakanibacter lacteus]|uniref:hypothetical protein n=1 Tax=Taklimakanibacter lacteus TaxID=2268456 RepID=UPI000E6752CD